MSDFTDFLAAMAIEDALEEDDHSISKGASKRQSNVSKTETSPGCIFSCCCIVFACLLGFLFDSFLLLIGITFIGAIIGLVYDIRRYMKKFPDIRGRKSLPTGSH